MCSPQSSHSVAGYRACSCGGEGRGGEGAIGGEGRGGEGDPPGWCAGNRVPCLCSPQSSHSVAGYRACSCGGEGRGYRGRGGAIGGRGGEGEGRGFWEGGEGDPPGWCAGNRAPCLCSPQSSHSVAGCRACSCGGEGRGGAIGRGGEGAIGRGGEGRGGEGRAIGREGRGGGPTWLVRR